MSRQFRFAPDPGGGSAGDVRLMFVVYTKATLRPGAVRARDAPRTPLGWQPIPCLPQWQLGGRRKASLTFTRAARPEGGEGDSQEEGEPSGSLSSCAQCGRAGRIPARDARAPRPALSRRIARRAQRHFHPLWKVGTPRPTGRKKQGRPFGLPQN